MPVLNCICLETMQSVRIPDCTVLCLGNFDGVHLAHRKLLASARAWRDQAFPNAAVGVFCFRELSSDELSDHPPGHLCTPEERLARFAECGMEFVVQAEFSVLRALTAEDYVRDILIGQCHCVAAACGYNHRYGRGGVGTSALLEQSLNGYLLVQPAVLDGEAPVSSTRIRQLLESGKPEEAARLLTCPYTLCAPVLHGKALGRTIGVPTVNQNFARNAVLPRFGVYATDCEISGMHYTGVSNVGIRPTVDRNATANCETYLLDFSGDLYGRTVTVSFLHFIRPEMKFDSVEALRGQIERDTEAVRACSASAGRR